MTHLIPKVYLLMIILDGIALDHSFPNFSRKSPIKTRLVKLKGLKSHSINVASVYRNISTSANGYLEPNNQFILTLTPRGKRQELAGPPRYDLPNTNRTLATIC